VSTASWSVKKFLIGEYLAKIQARIWLSRALSSSFSSVGQVHKVHETTTLLLVTLPNIHQFKKITETQQFGY